MDRLEPLRAFVRIVERGSFTAVAQELAVKQSTVSKWLAALEDELDIKLLDRTTRSVRVTDAGQLFYERAITVLATYDSALEELKTHDQSLRGRLRINLPVVFGRLYVAPLLAKLALREPELEVQMTFSDRYISPVEEGFDLTVRIGKAVDSSLRSHFLADTNRRLVASPDYLKRHGTPRTPSELSLHQCLCHIDPGARALWSFSKLKKHEQVRVRGRISADHSEVTLALARSGFGIARLASWLVDDELRQGRLVRVLPDYQLPKAPVRALSAPGSRLSHRLRTTLRFLREGLSQVLTPDEPTPT